MWRPLRGVAPSSCPFALKGFLNPKPGEGFTKQGFRIAVAYITHIYIYIHITIILERGPGLHDRKSRTSAGCFSALELGC